MSDIKNTTNPENVIEIPLTPIQEDEIDTNAVGDVQIKNGAITTKKIKAGSIIGDHILAGSITARINVLRYLDYFHITVFINLCFIKIKNSR